MIGWIAVAAVVAVYDAVAMRTGAETMSTVYRDAYQARPVLIGAATGYLVAHLTGYLPRRYDLFRAAA